MSIIQYGQWANLIRKSSKIPKRVTRVGEYGEKTGRVELNVGEPIVNNSNNNDYTVQLYVDRNKHSTIGITMLHLRSLQQLKMQFNVQIYNARVSVSQQQRSAVHPLTTMRLTSDFEEQKLWTYNHIPLCTVNSPVAMVDRSPSVKHLRNETCL